MPDAAAQLARRVRAEVGEAVLTGGAPVWESELTVAWAIAAPGCREAPFVASTSEPSFHLPLTRLTDSDVYCGAIVLANGDAMRWAYNVDGVEKGGGQL